MDQELPGLPGEAGLKPEFFISRAGPDAGAAQRIAHILEDAGRRVVIQDWDFKNRAFMERMHAALTSGARTIALLSPDYLTRDHCAAEWQNTIADDPLNRQSKLIVLRIRPCEPVGLLKSLAFWDLVPLLSAPEQDSLLRDAVLASVRTGRQKDPLSPITRFFEAAKPILHAEIKPTANFTGRAAALDAIGAALERGAKTAITQATAVHGLGGIGKSTLAREFARAAAVAGRYSGVWWLRAEKSKDSATWDGIEQGLADLRTVLYPGLEPPKERAKAARDTLNFLSSGGFEKPWLLVYDNVDDEEVLDTWAPPANVQVLMTSRHRNWGGEVVPVEVEEWELDEAIRYLREASGRGDLADAALTHIANELGRLPLALSHAAAYLKRNRAVTADTYLSELSRRMKEAPKGAAYKASVFATFQLAIEQVEAEAPGGRAVLSLAAFYAPDNIPEELFKQAPEIYPPALRPVAASEARLAEAISALDYLSLVDFDPATRTFSVHRLVQAAARDALTGQAASGDAGWIAAAVKACNAICPISDFEHWKAYERLLPHAHAAAGLAGDETGAPLASVLNALGLYLHAQAAYDEAEPLCERALAIWEKALGPEHPEVARALHNVARLYLARAAYAEAEPLCERALAIVEKALGPDHPDVALAQNNLAELYSNQGAYELAKPLLERALAIWEKALGPNHPDVAAALNNLAGLYRAQGAYERAKPLLERALDIRERALGPNHPDLAAALNNLAGLYHAQGAYERAKPLLERALAIWEKALGPNHPDVAAALNNLAGLYRARGAYERARPLFERALAVWEKALGPEHPDTKTARRNLAALQRAAEGGAQAHPKIARNSACPCGSGKKYKHCHGALA
jgi:tetratricopeptide (TPR) repeat protein